VGSAAKAMVWGSKTWMVMLLLFDPRLLVSPLYVAVSVWLPTARAVALNA
jgi:hypothetical protein